MKSQDIPIIGILLAIGAIVRYLSLMIPGPIVSNLVIAFYCLAVILVIPTFKETLGIGLVAGIICAMVSHSIFPPGNLISEPVGALVCLLTFLLLRNRIAVSPGIATFLGTLSSGCTFVAVAMLMMAPTIASSYGTMAAFTATIIPIVVLTAVANGIIAQILFIPASRALQRIRTGDADARVRTPPAQMYGSADDGAVLAARDFSYTYEGEGKPALRHVDATLRRGEVLLITGPTAAGKTTLCLAFAGVLHHESGGSISGEISLLGRELGEFNGIGEVSRHIGMMFDDADAQLIFTSVEEEMRSGLENRGLDAEAIEARITSVMQRCRIDDLRLRAPHTLSGGQKQRVALAVTLALDPEVIILDESMSELDGSARGLVISLLGELKAAGKTIIVVDHSIDDLYAIADKVVVLGDGAITLQGTPEGIRRHIPAKKEPVRCEPGVPPAPGTAGAPVLSVRDLCQYYGSIRALDAVSFDIYPGEFVAIVGENGSGKTTLVKHFNGLLRPRSGSVTVSGHNAGVVPVTDLVSHAGLVFQNPDTMLFENSVSDEVGFGVMNVGIEDAQERIAQALDLVHLRDKGLVYPRHLSRGERQRLAVACVLAMQPEVIILDEPTTGLDEDESSHMMALMKNLQQRGHTIVMVTHNMQIVGTYAERIIRMQGGRILSDGPVLQGGACA
jgi:energy-coupling factor transporter ATP-binding protein EcfA2